ncbi:M3 family oligoendopeptidase [Sporolactobacillus shoreicorticis]|uniref:M3 family oligoendopeptidase n=1 Tax=Sporolactobacillus shoreicorticis TaxID=1923877 RepID=A0ABW5S2Z5_9BACL|nr:M3 family oligoendopeptidase [Sporolactobacillus shoreicorticis]MCO7125810.1 M3 family oligoendopeptidase [Sporolactobacillus shoreicorticis]
MDELNQKWELDSIIKGSSFSTFLDDLQQAIRSFKNELEARTAPYTVQDAEAFTTVINNYETLCKQFNEGSAYAECLTAQNIKDADAALANNRMQRLGAELGASGSLLENLLRQTSDSNFNGLVENKSLKERQFALREKRELSRKKLGYDQEQLISSLAVDGYHGWENLYYSLIGKIEIKLNLDGKEKTMSVSQANNLLDDPDRSVRQTAFNALESAWSEHADLFAAALNHIAGFRIAVYRARGWDSVLDEPLDYNRMQAQTLTTMWSAVDRYKPKLAQFMQRKAELFKLKKLSWFDLNAPLNKSNETLTYEDAADFIIKHFGSFNPNMASFAKKAMENRWVEAENRANKRPGGFCTNFPIAKQSRIFMTFSGTASNRLTLAHELGHAYHQSLMNGLPYLSQNYAMNVAETASTFSEMIISDAERATAKTKEERIAFLSDKLERCVALLMNIHARFLFETRFYDERKQGTVSVDRLNQLMSDAEREAYHDTLEVYHPSFWASKLHFYITNWPFYNFPYTFGFLFSTGIYVRALQEGPSFVEKYDALLRDTGRMTTEQLAERHLGVDLMRPDFWISALDYLVRDVDEFLELTK